MTTTEIAHHDEEWRDIPGPLFGSFQASSLGRIRSLDRTRIQRMRDGSMQPVSYPGRVLRPHVNKTNGYPMINVSTPAMGSKQFTVHELVCRAFHGPRPDLHQVAHNDGI